MERLPPNIDTSGRKKYPVLFQMSVPIQFNYIISPQLQAAAEHYCRYGGPGSQKVSSVFTRAWDDYLACERKYIIVTVDGRGTGFKGRALRNPVTDNLGHWEVVDLIAAAREMTKRKYVDRSRIGIWGWVSAQDR